MSSPGCPEANIKAVVMQLVPKKCQTPHCTTVLLKVLYCKIKDILFFVFVFLCIICVKYYKPRGRIESDTTERLHFHCSPSCIGEGNGNPLPCSCLENPRDGGAWWAAVHGVAQSRTRLKRLSSSSRNWDYLRLYQNASSPSLSGVPITQCVHYNIFRGKQVNTSCRMKRKK